MFERQSRKTNSVASSKANEAAFSIGTDLNCDPVYLSGEVIPSKTFAQAMLALGKVVQIRKPQKKDHSAYQQWVQGEYLRILDDTQPDRMSRHNALIERRNALTQEENALTDKINVLKSVMASKTREYFTWLYENDRNAWIVLDPIVSVQKDGTFFEAFSGDESIYARVFLPHSALASAEKPSLGTTNIDYSLTLEREFARVRSYRPMSLTVGLNSVDFTTEAAIVEEEKIALPESWVRGLVEVQSVLSLAPITFELSADALAEIISRLQSEKEKHGPRSLRFRLEPGQPIRVEIEPWGEIFVDDWFTYDGELSTEVRIWGRRRLAVLQDILVGVEKVTVTFLGSGMPSFWSVTQDDVELTIGLSGWTSNDWAAKAKFSAFVPTSTVDQSRLPEALELITRLGSASTSEIAQKMNLKTSEASALLQKLCLQGKVMFDPQRSIYRWRDLFPTLDLYEEQGESTETRAGVRLTKEAKITITLDDLKDGVRYLNATIDDSKHQLHPSLELDADGRPKYAQCDCYFYFTNKLRQGPCRHMIALILAGE